MCRVKAARVLVAVALLFPGSFLCGQSWFVDAVPPWVSPASQDTTVRDVASRDGYAYLEYSAQYNLIAEPVAYYYNKVAITSQKGLTEWGQLSFDYNPEYERLSLHEVTVLRDGRALDKLSGADIRELQMEKDLSYLQYNGEVTLSVVLKDLRVGDVLCYSYSLTGENPSFRGVFYLNAYLAWGSPVGALDYRILTKSADDLIQVGIKTEEKFTVGEIGGHALYSYSRADIPPVDFDDNTPSWYLPNPRILLSNTKSWDVVKDKALELFSDSQVPCKEAESLVAELCPPGMEDKDKAVRLINFVQDNIRYFGYEMGINSHKPHRACDTLDNRYGDCKDKSVLLCVLLDLTGIDASPALVHSYMNELELAPPTPFVFNHCIVRMNLEGETYWIDPTVDLQSENLDTLYQYGYHKALVLDDSPARLEEIPDPAEESCFIRIEETLDCRDGGDGEGTLTVWTEYHGREAEYMRSQIASSGPAELKDQYEEYYSDLYPLVESGGDLVVSDDRKANILTIEEPYIVPGLWEDDDERGCRFFNYESLYLDYYLQSVNPQKRESPYALSYPLNVEKNVVFYLEGTDWDLNDDSFEVDREDIYFSVSSDTEQSEGDTIHRISYKYYTKRDYVSPGDMKAFSDIVDCSREYLSWEFTVPYDVASGEKSRWAVKDWINLFWVFMSLTIIIRMIKNYRRVKKQNAEPGGGSLL